LSSAELYDEAKATFPDCFDASPPKGTFFAYLSKLAKDPASKIATKGKKQGYYLDKSQASLEDSQDVQETTQYEAAQNSEGTIKNDQEKSRKPRIERERLLYPAIENWLIAQGYQSADTSSSRGLGKWGNPDVVGISALDAFSGVSIELVTVEAKSSLDNWEQWIFEAVSHRRFTNRSYFAFAHPDEGIAKIPQDMRYYSELYEIGILLISMDSDIYKELHASNFKASEIDPDNYEIIEIYAAPYHFVQPRYQLRFCESLGISCLKDLYRFGMESA
jgi:hypothetical protein